MDTYLGPPRERVAARAGVSSLGNGDYVLGVGSLDPRLSGAASPFPVVPPLADAGPDSAATHGRSFVLDGSGSSAAPGGRITEYRWRLTD